MRNKYTTLNTYCGYYSTTNPSKVYKELKNIYKGDKYENYTPDSKLTKENYSPGFSRVGVL